MTLFCRKQVTLHSGGKSDWIVDCANGLGPNDYAGLAAMAMLKLRDRGVVFTHVMGIPRGGITFATWMADKAVDMSDGGQAHLLLVDDVYSTGSSMEEYRRVQNTGYDSIHGLVIFDRSRQVLPDWITAIWRTDVPWI